MLVSDRLDNQLKENLLKLFVELDQSNPETFEAIKNGWTEAKQAQQYIAIGSEYYEPFKKQLGDRKTTITILQQFTN